MKLHCTYFVAGSRYTGSQEIMFHRVFNVLHTGMIDSVWASNYIQDQLEGSGGNVVFTQFNMVGLPQEVEDDFEL